ncbi:hypothetical protein ACFLCJ_004536, partial [Escherichia coli]
SPCVVASETICGMHENQSVKRSEQAWGAARAKGLDYKISNAGEIHYCGTTRRKCRGESTQNNFANYLEMN